MENTRSTGSVLAIIGGVGLAIAAFLTWATVSLNVAKFAAALGVDVGALGAAIPGASQSVSGTDGWEGKVAIVAGIVAIVVAVIAMREARKGLGVLLIVAGIVGGGVALYDIVTVNDQKESAIDDMAPQLQAVGIQPSQLSDAIDISLGAGIWICMIAGVIVIAGGVMVRSGEGAAQPTGGGMAMGSTMGSGFGAPATPPTGGTPPMGGTPPAASPTMPPVEPSPPPAEPSPPPADPSPPPADDGGPGTGP
jgi:hypothetical protein